MLTVDERKYIKMYLPYGTQVKIAKEVGTTRCHINDYFSGKIKNSPKIEKAVIAEFHRFQSERKALKEKIINSVE